MELPAVVVVMASASDGDLAAACAVCTGHLLGEVT